MIVVWFTYFSLFASSIFLFRLNVVCSARYPPLTDKKSAAIKFLLAKRYGLSLSFLPYLLVFGLGVASTFAFRYVAKVRKIIIYLRQLLYVLFVKQ